MMLTEAEVRDMGIPVARDLIGTASAWESHRCEEWRCEELRTLTGLDMAAYAPSGHGRTLVPPTYLVAQYVDTVSLGVPDAPIRFNGGNSCQWLRPAYVGDLLERSSRVVDVGVRAGARGVLVVYSLETTFRAAESGIDVARCGITAIRQYLNEASDESRVGGRARRGGRDGEARDAGALDGPNELAFGVCPTSRELVRYAAATGDFYEAHYDQEFAREKGLPGVIVHGLLKLGWFAGAAAKACNDCCVIEIDASYRRLDLVGKPLQVLRSPVRWESNRRGVIDLVARQVDGQISTFGRAVVVAGGGNVEDRFGDA